MGGTRVAEGVAGAWFFIETRSRSVSRTISAGSIAHLFLRSDAHGWLQDFGPGRAP